MDQHSKNQRNQNHVRCNGNNRPRNLQGARPVPREFNRGEQIDLVFIEEDFRGGVRTVAYLTDNTVVVPGTFEDYRFNPVPVTTTYKCSVIFGERVATALPRVPGDLTVQEWVHEKKVAACITATLEFRMSPSKNGGQARLISYYDGKVVLIDEGRENDVAEGSETLVQLIDKGRYFFAIPMKARARTETPKVAPFPVKADTRHDALTQVVQRVFNKKPGVIVVENQNDVTVKDEFRSIYAVLSSAKLGITVTAESSAEEIVSAADRITATLNGLLNGRDTLQKQNAWRFIEALEKAKTQALTILSEESDAGDEAEQGTETKTGLPDRQAQDNVQTAQAADQPKKRRRNRHRGGKNRNNRNGVEQQVAAPAHAVASRPAEPKGSFGTIGDVMAKGMTAAETSVVIVEKAELAPAPEPVAIVAPEPVVEVAPQPVASVEPPVETVVKTLAAAPAATEVPDVVTLAVCCSDPSFMKLVSTYKVSANDLAAAMRIAIGKDQCTDVKTFAALGRSIHRFLLHEVKKAAKGMHGSSPKVNDRA